MEIVLLRELERSDAVSSVQYHQLYTKEIHDMKGFES